MSKISNKDTKPEILVRKFLFSQGFRYRINVRTLPGKPDIVLPKYKIAIFVHGCFWHGHDCPLFRMPGTRADFWRDKIGRNRTNDQKAKSALLAAGWRVGVVWECAIRGSGKNIESVALLLGEWLRSEEKETEARG